MPSKEVVSSLKGLSLVYHTNRFAVSNLWRDSAIVLNWNLLASCYWFEDFLMHRFWILWTYLLQEWSGFSPTKNQNQEFYRITKSLWLVLVESSVYILIAVPLLVVCLPCSATTESLYQIAPSCMPNTMASILLVNMSLLFSLGISMLSSRHKIS